ncbi:MAG: ABC transporter substrate-binding protein, partial [Chloroflexota bacterium]
MVLSMYLCARPFYKGFTAIPVFPVRQFHHGAVTYNVKSGIQQPKDLEGKRVGVRTYTVSRGVWSRAVLASVYGVDLARVTWVVEDDDHMPEYRLPGNVEMVKGPDVAQMLVSGQIDAAIGVPVSASPDLRPLIAEPAPAEAQWFRSTGIYPMNHTVVIRDSLLQDRPDFARSVFASFRAAKEEYLAQLRAATEPSAQDRAMLALANLVGPDPLPYGVAQNRPALEFAIQSAFEQGIIAAKAAVEDIFVPDTLDLVVKDS